MKIMEQEYHIPMEENFKEEVSIMCNLSQGIKEAGIAEGREAGIAEGKQREIEKVILNMHKKGYSLEQIMDATELEAAELETIIFIFCCCDNSLENMAHNSLCSPYSL